MEDVKLTTTSFSLNDFLNFFHSPTLWQAIYPTQWARGNWSFDYDTPDLDRDLKSLESSTESLISNSSTADDSSSESTSERRGK